MIKMDFTGVTMSDGYSVLPAGRYSLSVQKTEEKTSSKGNPMVLIHFSAANEENEGSIVHCMVVTQKSRPIVKKFLYCINQPHEGTDVLIDPKARIGATLDAEVYVDTFTKQDGTTGESNKIKYFIKTMPNFPSGDSPETIETMDEDVPF